LKELESLGVQLVSYGQVSEQSSTLTLQPSIVKEIRVNQETDPELERITLNRDKGKSHEFLIHEDGTCDFRITCACPTM